MQPFKKSKDGRAAFAALATQHAGQDKWDKELQKCEELMTQRVWKGNGNCTLEKFVNQHRNAFASMQACAVHVDCQLPNGSTRVKCLIDAIQSAISQVCTDEEEGGMMQDFERTASHTIPQTLWRKNVQ